MLRGCKEEEGSWYAILLDVMEICGGCGGVGFRGTTGGWMTVGDGNGILVKVVGGGGVEVSGGCVLGDVNRAVGVS